MSHIGDHIKVVLFDHDDTLVATKEAKWAEHKHIARTHYDKELGDEEILQHWGKPLSELVKLLYGTDDVDAALEHEMANHNDFPKKLHDDTIATLQNLRKAGKKLGVITATSRASFNFDLNHMKIPKTLFDYTQTEDESLFHKPDPRVFDPALRWLKKNKIKPSETVYIGDALNDMKAAIGAGFSFIGVGTGLITVDEFKRNGAKVIRKLSDLRGTT